MLWAFRILLPALALLALIVPFLLQAWLKQSRHGADDSLYLAGKPSVTVSTDSDFVARELPEWITQGGGVVNGVAVRGKGARRGVYAREALLSGTVFLSLRPAQVMTEQEVIASGLPLVQELLAVAHQNQDANNPLDVGGLVLAMWLLHERKLAASSWRTILDALPQTEDFSDHPAMLSEEDAVQCVANATRTVKKLRSAREKYFTEFAIVSKLPSWEGSREEFAWARLVVSTRAFTVPRKSSAQDAPTTTRGRARRKPVGRETALALVPFADMLNHGHKANAMWRYTDEGGFEMLSKGQVAQGSELLHNYGSRSSEAMLVSYGFAGPPTVRDVVDITVSVGGRLTNVIPTLQALSAEEFANLMRPLREPSRLAVLGSRHSSEAESLRALAEGCEAAMQHGIVETMEAAGRYGCAEFVRGQISIARVFAEFARKCLHMLEDQNLPQDLADDSLHASLVSFHVLSWALDVGEPLLPAAVVREASERLGRISGEAFMELLFS